MMLIKSGRPYFTVSTDCGRAVGGVKAWCNRYEPDTMIGILSRGVAMTVIMIYLEELRRKPTFNDIVMRVGISAA